MEKKQRVIVYGNSVVLAGIEAGLSLESHTEVIRRARTDHLEDLTELHPDVVIFDVDDVQSEFLRAQLQSQTDLLLIGIDPESHEVLLTGQAARSITLDQLTRIMQSRDPPCAEEPAPPRAGNQLVEIRKTFPTEFLQGENNENKHTST